MDPVYRYDEVHSVSDLHIGGRKGFQVFDLGTTLARFIDHLRKQPKERQVALVINGDFVDFLAEDPAAAFDPDGAAAKLDRIAADPAFKPVFTALQRFARTPGRQLVVTLGNHDLELALPWVAERLLEHLSGGTPAARGRILLSFDGSGFLCGVGGRRILFVHGNEVDTWNLCDYEHLRRLRRDLTQGKRVEPWTPNAGARMVVEVMNSIKKRYRFVDLLKPETEAAVPLLLALEPSQAVKLRSVLPAVGRRLWDAGRKLVGFLSAEEEAGADDLRAGELELQRIVESRLPVATAGTDVEEMLDRVEERMAAGVDPHQVLDRDRREEYLSVTGAVWKALRGADREEVVREALQGLKRDQSFDLAHEDQTFQDLDALIGAEIDVLVAGHTHLERRIPRKKGSGTYLNTGTWIRLIRLGGDVLDDPDEFKRLFQALDSAEMAQLDAFHTGTGASRRPLVLRRPAVASIVDDGGRVRADLARVDLATGTPVPRPGDAEGGEP